MCVKKINIGLIEGLNILNSTRIVQMISKFKTSISIRKNNDTANARSILELVSLEVEKGESVIIVADGKDEKEVINKLQKFVTD